MDIVAKNLGFRLRRLQKECDSLMSELATLDEAGQANARLVQILGTDCPFIATEEDMGEEAPCLVVRGTFEGSEHEFVFLMESDYRSFFAKYAGTETMTVPDFVAAVKGFCDWTIGAPCGAGGGI